MRIRATEAFPIIEKRIDDLTIGFKRKVDESLESITSMNNNLTGFVKLNLEQMENIVKETVSSYNENSSLIKHQSEQINLLMNETKINNEKIMQETNKNIDRLYHETSTRIEKQLTDLDDQLGDELNKAISSLGSQLASLSNKFVEDYSPLTDKLANLIRVSRGVYNAQ